MKQLPKEEVKAAIVRLLKENEYAKTIVTETPFNTGRNRGAEDACLILAKDLGIGITPEDYKA